MSSFEVDIDALRVSHSITGHPKFQAMLKAIDPKGHRFWKLPNGDSERNSFHDLGYIIYAMGTEKLSKLSQSLETGIPMSEFMGIQKSSLAECGDCGEWVLLETDGATMQVGGSCQCPPVGPIEFELNVPSGTMVYADDLRPYFDSQVDFSLNCRLGLIRQSQAMAAIGCAHGFVGNSCPDVYSVNDSTLVVASVATDDEGRRIDRPGRMVGQIVTDLWWYSFADADEFKRRGGMNKDHVSRLKVRPGVYRFSHNLRTQSSGDMTFVFATITWMREPDPVKEEIHPE